MSNPDKSSLADTDLQEIRIDEKKGNVIHTVDPADQLEIIFRDLQFSVPVVDPITKKPSVKRILKGVTGTFQPGRLTVILGSSGAGKTTLLNAIAGAATAAAGTLEGELLVNGKPATGRDIRKMSGYVYQDDVMFHTMTVREAVMLSARLRTPSSIPLDVKRERVDELLSFLGLSKAADTMIGNERIKGVSGGERKRTSIAMELVTNPAILFLDEPTSGLDTFTAFSVVQFLKKLAQAGHTIVATLHQPSSEIFHMIDDLILMSDGRILYAGAANKAVEYFASQGYPCPQYSNPADFFFMSVYQLSGQSSSASTIDKDNDMGRERASTAGHSIGQSTTQLASESQDRLNQLLDIWPTTPAGQELQRRVASPREGGFSEENRKYRSSFFEQFPLVYRRALRHVMRDKMVIGARLGQIIVMALIFNLIYWQINERDQSAQIQDRGGVLFFYTASLIMSNAMGILNVFGNECHIFEREKQSGMYGLPAFFFSKMAVELPVYIILPILLVSTTYWGVGLNPGADNFLVTCLICILLSLSGVSIGILAASAFSELSIALAVVPLAILPMMLFGGLFANLNGLPAWVSWLKWLSLMKYGFVALAKNEYQGIEIGCGDDVPKDQCKSPLSGEDAIKNLGIEDQGSIWVNVLALLGWWLLFMSLAYFALWRRTRIHQPSSKAKQA
jgi:ABC-type multidrug transport system ATPase subunit